MNADLIRGIRDDPWFELGIEVIIPATLLNSQAYLLEVTGISKEALLKASEAIQHGCEARVLLPGSA
jgi:hypothetical protein